MDAVRVPRLGLRPGSGGFGASDHGLDARRGRWLAGPAGFERLLSEGNNLRRNLATQLASFTDQATVPADLQALSERMMGSNPRFSAWQMRAAVRARSRPFAQTSCLQGFPCKRANASAPERTLNLATWGA